MSKGLGRVQREILAVLTSDRQRYWWPMIDLAAKIGDTPHPSRSAVESVRRAAKSLAALGALELEMSDDDVVAVRSSRVDRGDGYAYRPVHSSTRATLYAHLPLSVEEKTRREQSIAASLDALVALDRNIP